MELHPYLVAFVVTILAVPLFVICPLVFTNFPGVQRWYTSTTRVPTTPASSPTKRGLRKRIIHLGATEGHVINDPGHTIKPPLVAFSDSAVTPNASLFATTGKFLQQAIWRPGSLVSSVISYGKTTYVWNWLPRFYNTVPNRSITTDIIKNRRDLDREVRHRQQDKRDNRHSSQRNRYRIFTKGDPRSCMLPARNYSLHERQRLRDLHRPEHYMWKYRQLVRPKAGFTEHVEDIAFAVCDAVDSAVRSILMVAIIGMLKNLDLVALVVLSFTQPPKTLYLPIAGMSVATSMVFFVCQTAHGRTTLDTMFAALSFTSEKGSSTVTIHSSHSLPSKSALNQTSPSKWNTKGTETDGMERGEGKPSTDQILIPMPTEPAEPAVLTDVPPPTQPELTSNVLPPTQSAVLADVPPALIPQSHRYRDLVQPFRKDVLSGNIKLKPGKELVYTPESVPIPRTRYKPTGEVQHLYEARERNNRKFEPLPVENITIHRPKSAGGDIDGWGILVQNRNVKDQEPLPLYYKYKQANTARTPLAKDMMGCLDTNICETKRDAEELASICCNLLNRFPASLQLGNWLDAKNKEGQQCWPRRMVEAVALDYWKGGFHYDTMYKPFYEPQR